MNLRVACLQSRQLKTYFGMLNWNAEVGHSVFGRIGIAINSTKTFFVTFRLPIPRLSSYPYTHRSACSHPSTRHFCTFSPLMDSLRCACARSSPAWPWTRAGRLSAPAARTRLRFTYGQCRQARCSTRWLGTRAPSAHSPSTPRSPSWHQARGTRPSRCGTSSQARDREKASRSRAMLSLWRFGRMASSLFRQRSRGCSRCGSTLTCSWPRVLTVGAIFSEVVLSRIR